MRIVKRTCYTLLACVAGFCTMTGAIVIGLAIGTFMRGM